MSSLWKGTVKNAAKSGLKSTAKTGGSRAARAAALKRVAALRKAAASRSASRAATLRSGRAVGQGITSAANACIKNKKMCVGAAVAVGVGAYMYDKYGEMDKEQKQCMTTCFPEDWQEYVDGEISTPNYKVIGGRSKKDQELTYAALYEDDDMKNNLCTLEKLAENNIPEGKDSCNEFCEAVCDFDVNDLVRETASDLTGGASTLGGAAWQGFFDGLGIDFEQVKKYGIMALVAILILSVLSILIKVAL